jgi:hypothetical protein
MRWAGHEVARVMVGRPEGKGPLERPRRRWEYGTRADLWEEGGEWGCTVYPEPYLTPPILLGVVYSGNILPPLTTACNVVAEFTNYCPIFHAATTIQL